MPKSARWALNFEKMKKDDFFDNLKFYFCKNDIKSSETKNWSWVLGVILGNFLQKSQKKAKNPILGEKCPKCPLRVKKNVQVQTRGEY